MLNDPMMQAVGFFEDLPIDDPKSFIDQKKKSLFLKQGIYW